MSEFPLGDSAKRVGKHGALQPKGDISAKTQKRHFKDMKTPHIGDGILPVRQAEEIPHFPEKTADNRRNRHKPDACPVPCFQGAEYCGVPGNFLNRGDQDKG